MKVHSKGKRGLKLSTSAVIWSRSYTLSAHCRRCWFHHKLSYLVKYESLTVYRVFWIDIWAGHYWYCHSMYDLLYIPVKITWIFVLYHFNYKYNCYWFFLSLELCTLIGFVSSGRDAYFPCAAKMLICRPPHGPMAIFLISLKMSHRLQIPCHALQVVLMLS